MAGRYFRADDNTNDPFAPEAESESDFEKMLDAETSLTSAKRYKIGESIIGDVIHLSSSFLFVDLGGKSTGALSVEEYTSAGESVPAVGTQIKCFVRQDNGSEIVLTRSLRRGEIDSSSIQQAFEAGVPIEAKIEKVTKGGFEASVAGKRAFVPLSQMEMTKIADESVYVGGTFKFHVTEFKQGGRNIVLSRRELLREDFDAKRQHLLGTLEVGQSVHGTVTRTATFGAFADIGGVEGLIPMSELSWKRVKSAEEVVKIGESVQLKILKIEHAPKLRIALSLKSAGEDPWLGEATRLTAGTQRTGTVTRLSDFGAFIELAPGVEGLAHISQLSWEKRVVHPREVLTTGQSLEVTILDCDLAGKKISLSVKGPMPEELRKKLMNKADGLNDEERGQMAQWQEFQTAAKKQNDANPTGGLFANAFANARRRK